MLAPLSRTLERCFRRVHLLPESVQMALWRLRSKFTGEGRHLWERGDSAEERFLDHLQHSDRLLLAALKLTEAPAARHTAPAFQAVSLGEHRLLAAHPVLPFIYLDPRDLTQTPYIVAGQFQPELSLLLTRVVRPTDRILELGAGQGYHTLSLAQLVGLHGEIIAVEANPTHASALRDNVTAHDLGDTVEVVVHDPAEADLDSLTDSAPDVIRVDSRCAVDKVLPALARKAHDNLRIILSFARGTGHVEEAIRTLGLPLWQLHDGAFQRISVARVLADAVVGRVDVVAARSL